MSTPPHRDPRLLAAVWVGGVTGTGLRWLTGALVPAWDGLPWSTWLVNVLGSFLLGLLLQFLVLRGAETPRRRLVRLTLGTGLLGGFTTFSQFVLDVDTLVGAGRVATSVGYLVASIGGGLAAAAAGMLTASRLPRRRP